MPIGPFRKKPANPRPLSLALRGGRRKAAEGWLADCGTLIGLRSSLDPKAGLS